MRVSSSTFRARQRQAPTDAESLLWNEVRNRSLGGYKFARQVSTGAYTADFVCRRQELIVELDGPEHLGNQRDHQRTPWLNEHGYSVLRFWNDEVIMRRPQALKTLLDILEDRAEGTEQRLNYSPALPPERVG